MFSVSIYFVFVDFPLAFIINIFAAHWQFLAAHWPLLATLGPLLAALGLLLAGLGTLLAALEATCKNHTKTDAQKD